MDHSLPSNKTLCIYITVALSHDHPEDAGALDHEDEEEVCRDGHYLRRLPCGGLIERSLAIGQRTG